MDEPKRGIGCFGVTGIIFLILLGLGLLGRLVEGIKTTYFSPPAPINKTEDPPVHTTPRDPAVSAPLNEPRKTKSSTEYLKEAKDQLAMKNADRPYGDIYHAAYLLSFIPSDAPEYKEAQALLKKIAKLKEKDLAEIKKRTAEELRIKRMLYAPLLENKFLDKGYDVTVKTLGKDDTTLHIKWVLTSRLTVHHITKDGELIRIWREMGFRKVVFTDGYRSKWELTP